MIQNHFIKQLFNCPSKNSSSDYPKLGQNIPPKSVTSHVVKSGTSINCNLKYVSSCAIFLRNHVKAHYKLWNFSQCTIPFYHSL